MRGKKKIPRQMAVPQNTTISAIGRKFSRTEFISISGLNYFKKESAQNHSGYFFTQRPVTVNIVCQMVPKSGSQLSHTVHDVVGRRAGEEHSTSPSASHSAAREDGRECG